jgi:hypothetical protein
MYNELFLYSDHEALKYIHCQNKLSSRHTIWETYIHQFSFFIKYKFGALNKVVDVLSRKTSLLVTM